MLRILRAVAKIGSVGPITALAHVTFLDGADGGAFFVDALSLVSFDYDLAEREVPRH